ncbi:hypothetical protein, partial [Bifidobacterium pullorum]|uniref:hypothetical protein n=1 Tax=Bifidobacterium pullorum TaxID=78448 RepID=UPI00195A877E
VSTAEKKLSGNIGHTDAVISTYIPVVTGSSTAGTASYSLQEGYYENITDDLVYFSASCT